jgi:hypothetical protein
MHALSLALALALAAGQQPDQPAATSAQASTDDAILRQRVEALLGRIDRPVTAQHWLALGPAAIPILTEIASSPSERSSRRANALAGLATLGGPEAERLHLALARDQKAPWNVRGQAVRGAGVLLPAERVEAEVAPVLSTDPDDRVRADAAEVMVKHAINGCAAVKAHLAAREPGRSRALVGRALRHCQ